MPPAQNCAVQVPYSPITYSRAPYQIDASCKILRHTSFAPSCRIQQLHVMLSIVWVFLPTLHVLVTAALLSPSSLIPLTGYLCFTESFRAKRSSKSDDSKAHGRI